MTTKQSEGKNFKFKTLKVTIEWPLELFESLAGATADLCDELVAIEHEEPDYFSSQKHIINGDDKHKMFEATLHYHFNKRCDERIAVLKAWFQAYKRSNIGVNINYEER